MTDTRTITRELQDEILGTVRKNQAAVERARAVLTEISSADSFDLAILSVALRTIRTLLRANAM